MAGFIKKHRTASMKNSKSTIKILLYGSSILMESLASKLDQVSDWEVSQSRIGEVKSIESLNYIVTDLCDTTTSNALPMLASLPGVMLIGVDAIANTVTVLTGRSNLIPSAQGVMDALKKAI